MLDFCGYCGRDFQRARSEPPEICGNCLQDPATAKQYEEDSALEAAERANDEELAHEARKYL